MNHLTKKAAINKYGDLPPDELEAALKGDDKNFSEEEIKELIEAIGGKSQPKELTGNAALDLSKFDYQNLKGDSFKKYNELIESLKWNDNYTFEQYRAVAVKAERYPGMQGTPIDIIGINLVKDKPIRDSKIPVKTAINLNSQIGNGDDRCPAVYYLLKK